MKIWSCKIGSVPVDELPPGADVQMRQAVEAAYFALTGKTPEFVFSGWGATLDEYERAEVDEAPEPTMAEVHLTSNPTTPLGQVVLDGLEKARRDGLVP